VDLVSAPPIHLSAASTELCNVNGGTLQRVEHERAGKHNIEDEIISPNNDTFILHDSEGFERLNTSKYDAVREFIEGRREQPKLEDQLHAIWCVRTSPFPASPLFGLILFCNFRLPKGYAPP
jgi:hypothetical protein